MLVICFDIFLQRDCSDKLEYHLAAEMNNNSKFEEVFKGRLIVRCQTLIGALAFISH